MKLNRPPTIAVFIIVTTFIAILAGLCYGVRSDSLSSWLGTKEVLAEEASSGSAESLSAKDYEATLNEETHHDGSAFSLGETGGYLAGENLSKHYTYLERRFTDPTGVGFAAEEANNFIDRLKGMDAEVTGYELTKNGPDRAIVNRDGSVTYIQDKYYQSANESVQAAFESGEYRYVRSDGTVMQLEVPADQYEKAVELMRKRIEKGQVPGVQDPAEAENLVRKGNLTYKQAVNLTKAGNLTSLKYDATQGVISAAPVAGITFVVDFLVCTNDGMPVKDAIGESAKSAMVSGSAVFAGHMLSAQLMKTGLADVMAPTAESITAWLGDDACRAIVKAAGGETAGMTSATLAKQAGRILNSRAIFNAGFVIVLSIPDALDLYQGRMSKGQFAKNLAVLVIGMAGAGVGEVAGGAVGTHFAPGIGTTAGKILGGIAGGTLGGTVGDLIGDKIFKDDADQMYDIVSQKFSEYCFDYVVSEKEAERLATELNGKLTESGLKDMFASKDRGAYAANLMEPMFEEVAKNRAFENFPETEYEVRTAMLDGMNGVVYIH